MSFKGRMQIIDFKSWPSNWLDEKIGIKKWTIRDIDFKDKRFKILLKYYKIFLKSNSIKDLYIRISNTETMQPFKRKVSHLYILREKDRIIISWM